MDLRPSLTGTIRDYQYIPFYNQIRRSLMISADARKLAIAQGTAVPHQKRFCSPIGQPMVRKCSPITTST